MLTTLSLWVWYIIVVIIAWIIFYVFSKMPILTSILVASLFGLIIGLVLLPYYQTDNLSVDDTNSLNAFIVIATIIPILALIFAVTTGEHKKYWINADGSDDDDKKSENCPTLCSNCAAIIYPNCLPNQSNVLLPMALEKNPVGPVEGACVP